MQSIFLQNFIQPNAGIHVSEEENGTGIEFTRAQIPGV